MHQHGKDDVDMNAGNAFCSNTFPLVSRSSMKRPLSLASEREREHHESGIRDHFRSRGFRSRAKTIHSDTIRTPLQLRDLLGPSSNTFVGFANANSDRSSVKGYLDAFRRKQSSNHGTLSTSTSTEKKPYLVMRESILDEEMAVDDDDDDDDDDGAGKPMESLLENKSTPTGNHSSFQHSDKQVSTMSIGQHLTMNLDYNSNPTSSTQLFSSQCTKSKLNFYFPNKPPSTNNPVCSVDAFRRVETKQTVPKPTLDCCKILSYGDLKSTIGSDTVANNSLTKAGNQISLSPLAVPKAASSSNTFECKNLPCPIAVPTHIPTEAEKEQFQRSLDSATSLVFHRRSGLPLTSSPAPIRKSGNCFDFDSSLTSVNAIKKALFRKDPDGRDFSYSLRSRSSFSTPTTTSALLGNFEESVLNGRLEPASIVNGFTAEIGASGTFCPKHKTLPVTVFFYALQDSDKGEKISSPYLGHINLGPKGYHVPRQGTVQVTLFNPNGTVVKMFVVRYNLSDMPPNSRTFLRQRTLFMPSDANEHHADNRKWLRYLIHLRFQSSKSGRIRLHTDIRILVFRKHDLDVATLNGGVPYELRSFVQMPSNPKYSKNIKS